MRWFAIATVLLCGRVPVVVAQELLPPGDGPIWRAVLDQTVRPYVVNFSNRMDAQPPYRLLVLNETVPNEMNQASVRQESARMSVDLGPDVILVSRDGIEDALNEWKESAVGYLTFSRPAYASDGRAQVWVGFVCRGCGRGWMFTLRRDDGNWLIDSVRQTILD